MNLVAPTLVFLTAVLFSSCSTTTRHVSIAELETRLQRDTRKQGTGKHPSYQWSYIGSTLDHHYFRRQVVRIFYSEFLDGVYGVPRAAIRLSHVEFPRPNPDDSSQWKGAFTEYSSHGMPRAYSTRFGVDEQIRKHHKLVLDNLLPAGSSNDYHN